MQRELKDRKDVDLNLTWDLSSIFKTNEEFMGTMESIQLLASKMEIEFKGKLNTAKNINACLDLYREIFQLIYSTGSYVELALSVDYSNSENQARYIETKNKISDVESRLSFIKSELIESADKEIEQAIQNSKENSHYLEDIKREKPYMLNPEVERVLAALATTLDAPYHIYEQSKLADMDFPSFTVDEKMYPLGYAMCENEYEYEVSTKVRREAFAVF